MKQSQLARSSITFLTVLLAVASLLLALQRLAEAQAPMLTISKTSDAGGIASPSNVINYTIVVANTGVDPATGIAISDTLPVGTTYVPGSIRVVPPPSQAPGAIADDFDDGVGGSTSYAGNDGTYGNWNADWQEIGEADGATAGAARVVNDAACPSGYCLGMYRPIGTGVSREADLSAATSVDLTFDYSTYDTGGQTYGEVTLSLSDDGSTWVPVSTYAIDGTGGSASLRVEDYVGLTANTTLRFQITVDFDNPNDRFYVDNVVLTIGSVVGGTPPALVTAADGYDLQPGESMTVTYQVQVANPLPVSVTEIINTASVASTEIVTPITATVTDLVFIPQLSVVKVSDVVSSILPGDTITYTVLVSNQGICVATNVTLSDTLPVGTTYVPGSGQVTLSSSQGLGTIADDFDDGVGGSTGYAGNDGTYGNWNADWQEIGEADGATLGAVRVVNDAACPSGYCLGMYRPIGTGVSREADLSAATSAVLTFDYSTNGSGGSSAGEVTLSLSDDGSTWVPVSTYAIDGTGGSASFRVEDYVGLTANTTLRFQITVDFDNPSDRFYVDNVVLTIGSVVGSTPPGLVTTADGYDLQPGESMTVTYQVMATNPLPAGVTEIVNTASVASTEIFTPFTGSVTDTAIVSSIGDLVWNDRDGDGAQQAGEPGLAGAVISLALPSGSVVTTTTGITGSYDLAGLAPGTYTVTVVSSSLPAGLTLTAGADPLIVTLGAGEDFDGGDFGYLGNVSIGDLVWNDVSGEGLQDAGEPGIPGAVVELVLSGGATITTSTDASGAYNFAGLGAGGYTVVVDGSSVPTTYTLTTANIPLAVTLSAGQVYTDARFGYRELPTWAQLVSFAVVQEGDYVRITWETAAELDNVGFNLYRSEAPDGEYIQLNESLIPGQHPGSSMGATYTWTDLNVQPGQTYYYRLEDVDVRGVHTAHGPVSVAMTAQPTGFQIYLPLVHK